ncbi:MAG: S9 family peptidase [Oscillatoria sp. PMC 1068.18]|nr:S9 family peptidase [Oscillatoria sp. PMC 1076.18]MEC4990707.1 S9 family peptidase [Oscillatoria sp. PMC 1068.18]
MTQAQIKNFGSWKSPIASDLIVSQTIALNDVAVDGEDIYWLESRPTEKGRNVLVRQAADGTVTDITPAPFNVRTRVHEYGGGAFLVTEGTVYFINFADQRIYKQNLHQEPQTLTTEGNRRYANAILDKPRNRLICVCEEHQDGAKEPKNSLVAVDLHSGEVTSLLTGSDFYSSPRLSPDGTRLAWLEWNHPDLPWDSTQLYVGKIQADGAISEAECVAGGDEESICQPEWSPDGILYFVSDRTNWWNLYRYQENTVESLCPMEAEFGYPHWVFGVTTYIFESAESIICTYTHEGSWFLARFDVAKKELQPIETRYTSINSVEVISPGKIVFIAGSPTQPTVLVEMEIEKGIFHVLKESSKLEIDPGYLSVPEAISFPTDDGKVAYAWYYPPKNQDYTPPTGELPPLLVKSHGGPTAAASATFNLKIQYWTSRGFGYLDVNYGGSTGYGRKYRQRLEKRWGIVDVNDCANAAKYLAEQGKVDRDRLAITGGSAGGYTTLAALTFLDVFKAGASYYGVSDLETLATDTHKFESRYLDRLIGKYPEEKEVYVARSPIHFTEKLSCPVIFFQGLQDKVVPPNQAEKMVTALQNKGLPVAYVAFPDEQHGFRSAENIKRALDGEFYFYSRIFGFQPADEIEPVEIMNLPSK